MIGVSVFVRATAIALIKPVPAQLALVMVIGMPILVRATIPLTKPVAPLLAVVVVIATVMRGASPHQTLQILAVVPVVAVVAITVAAGKAAAAGPELTAVLL